MHLRARGGRILAISADSPEESRAVVEAEKLPFRLLSDERLQVIRATGLAHEGGGPDGETIAIPAQILLRQDGTIAWRFVSSRITERATPQQTQSAIEGL